MRVYDLGLYKGPLLSVNTTFILEYLFLFFKLESGLIRQWSGDSMRIVFLGASLTEGVYGGSYVDRVARNLPQHEIINSGLGGSTMNRIVSRLDDVIAQQADAVFILAGSNDAIAYSQPKTRPYYKQSQDLPDGYLTPEAFGQLYRDLLVELQLAHIQPLIGLPPLEYNPAVVAASNLFNAQAVEAASAYNVPVLDLNPLLLPKTIPDRPELDLRTIFVIGDRTQSGWSDYEVEQQKGGYTYSFDGIHFTPATAERVGDVITDFLRETLDLKE
jgi:lysophospholipase L1-like esterase